MTIVCYRLYCGIRIQSVLTTVIAVMVGVANEIPFVGIGFRILVESGLVVSGIAGAF